jgi:hypothetical protein
MEVVSQVRPTFHQFRQGEGKKLTFPEWGISILGPREEYDRPRFIRGMFELFHELAEQDLLLAETYFHRHKHKLMPSNNAPACSSEYQRLWAH